MPCKIEVVEILILVLINPSALHNFMPNRKMKKAFIDFSV